jgi:hypothetical protein
VLELGSAKIGVEQKVIETLERADRLATEMGTI